MNFRLILGVVPLVVLAASVAFADERVEQLDRENRQLRARIAMLEQQVATLKEAASPSVGDGEPARAGEDAGGSEKGGGKGPVLRSLEQVLKAIPSDYQLRPAGDGWDTTTIDRFADGLRYTLWNRPVRLPLTIKAVTVRDNPAASGDANASPHQITLSFESERIEYTGQPMVVNIPFLTLYGDAPLANRARGLEPGKRVHLLGRIKTIQPPSNLGTPYQQPLQLHLQDPELGEL